MALELKAGLRLSQNLVMTPQLQQAIKLLQLNRLEMVEMINQELVENPLLEENAESIDASGQDTETSDVEASAQNPEAEQKRDEEAFERPKDKEEQLVNGGQDDFNWEAYIEEFNSAYSGPSSPSMKEVNEELPSFDAALTKSTTLDDHLLWQLSMTTISEAERKLGTLIICNLSDDGYLAANLEDLAREAGMESEDAEELLKLIQRFDPVGVGSRDLRECLLVQASLLNPRHPLVEKVIDQHLGDLEKRNYQTIAKALSVPIEQIFDATRFIQDLEPKPGRSFPGADTQYITPDIYVYKIGSEFVIMLNEDGLPKLKISPYYKNILALKPADNKDTRNYVQEKLRSAMWLIRSIANRQKTIYKVTEAIVSRQRDFFDKGVQHLKPMILKDVANDIGMHESTVSRVTTNKFVHTPVGIFELKYFFNSSISANDGGDSLASEAVKEKIRQLVAKEDPKHPLSDQRIVELLKSNNIDIARRTVAKYRDMLGILSSGKRKKVF